MKFYVPHGVAPETLASGRPLVNGEFLDISKKETEDEHNARLIEQGTLLPATEAAEKAAKEAKKIAAEAVENANQEGGDD